MFASGAVAVTEIARESTHPATAEVRTFLIADVRGYTRFTLEQGDAAAARLSSRLAGIARELVSAHEGEVIELRTWETWPAG